MASVVSDCKERCIHYWVCKNCEQYQQVIAKEVRLQLELPDYVTAITDVSLLCKNQIIPKYNNNSPKYLKIRVLSPDRNGVQFKNMQNTWKEQRKIQSSVML